MQVLIQWAQRTPRDWVTIDSAEWDTLPNRGVPPPGRMNDPGNQAGWVNRLCVQGVEFPYDHYHVRNTVGGAIEVATWNDDPEDTPLEDFYAAVWTFRPLFQDPRIGGGWNTDQSRVIYAASNAMVRFQAIGPMEKTVLRPWEEFAAPTNARHGVWLSDTLYAAHSQKTSRTSFLDWVT